MPRDARGGFPSPLEAAPVRAARRPSRRTQGIRPTPLAVDLPVVAVRAEKERQTARCHRALNESNRVHAAIATAGNWIANIGTCDSCARRQPSRPGLGGSRLRALPLPSPRSSSAQTAEGQLSGALRFPRSHALADMQLVSCLDRNGHNDAAASLLEGLDEKSRVMRRPHRHVAPDLRHHQRHRKHERLAPPRHAQRQALEGRGHDSTLGRTRNRRGPEGLPTREGLRPHALPRCRSSTRCRACGVREEGRVRIPTSRRHYPKFNRERGDPRESHFEATSPAVAQSVSLAP